MTNDNSWDEFLHDAELMGSRKKLDSLRNIHVAMPEGSLEDELASQLISKFQTQGFRILDLTNCSPSEAIKALNPSWPKIANSVPSAEFFIDAPPEWDKLVVVGGKRFEKAFWEYLCDESILYDGAGYPPAYPYYVVPNNVVVAAAIPLSIWSNYSRLDFFGAVYRFSNSGWFKE